MSDHTTQENIERDYSKYQLITKLREEFSELSEDSFIVDTVIHIYLHRQASPETMVGILSPKYGSPQEVADKLLQAVHDDFLDYDEIREVFIVKYDIDEDTQRKLSKYQYPLPMIIKPLKVTNNNETGYISITNSIILNSKKIGKGKSYFRDTDQCLDHINRANSVKLALDLDLAINFQVPKLERKIGEEFEDYKKRLKQKNVFYDTSVEVMQELASVSDEIYLTHRYDRRGRCYASGYHVNYQGDDYHKAVIQLANKEVINV